MAGATPIAVAGRQPAALGRDIRSAFSSAAYRPILRGESPDRLDAATRRIRKVLEVDGRSSNAEVISHALSFLRRWHRSEYFYKNLLASKIFFGRHRAARAAVIPEFRIGSSIADFVIVNGRATAYEVKTELDNPRKLVGQLDDYYQGFTDVYVVTHESLVSSYLEALDTTAAGLISIGSRATLRTVKVAHPNWSGLRVKPMMDSLRRSEVTQILESEYQTVKNVPSGRVYEYQLEMSERLPPTKFQVHFQHLLRARRPKAPKSLLFDPLFGPLRALVLQLDPNADQAERLLDWLRQQGG